MHADTSPPPLTAADAGRPWQTLAVLAGLLAVEACLGGWLFGPWLLAIPGKRWVGFALLGIVGALWAHIDKHRSEYASVRLSWPLIAGQIVSFAAACGGLAWMAADPRSLPEDGILPLSVAVMTVPLSWALAALAPNLTRAWQLLGSAALCAAFVVAAWAAGDLTSSFWEVSGGATMQLVESLLTPLADGPVIRPEPFVIGTDSFQVRIAPSCSGFHGIGLMTALLAGSLWWFRSMYRFPQSFLLLPLGVILMWLANAVRITALILVGIWISPSIAVDGFHSVAGWIGFLVVGLGIIWAASRSTFFTLTGEAAADGARLQQSLQQSLQVTRTLSDGNIPATTCLLPFLVLTGVTMLTQAFTSGFDLLYPLRVIAVAGVLWYLRGTLRWQDCRISLLPVGIGIVCFVVWMLLAPAPTESTPLAAVRDPLQLPQPWATLWLLFRVAGSTITVPIAEELFFRGFVTRRCIAEDVDSVPMGQFSWFSCAVSSVAFGLLHGDAWLAGIVAGLFFAAALSWRRRLVDAVVAHATTNALLSAYVIVTRSWSAWG
jgi:exosortase E/protease (VPEID-CTERM system)